MALIGFLGDKSKVLNEFLTSFMFRSSNNNIVKNPFNIKVKNYINDSNKTFLLLSITPVYPPVFWFGFLLLFPFIIFQWFNFFLLLPLFLISMGFFWSAFFYKLLIRKALIKKGYKNDFKFLSKNQIIWRLAEWDK